MIRSYLGTLKTYMVEENASLDFRLKKLDEKKLSWEK